MSERSTVWGLRALYDRRLRKTLVVTLSPARGRGSSGSVQGPRRGTTTGERTVEGRRVDGGSVLLTSVLLTVVRPVTRHTCAE